MTQILSREPSDPLFQPVADSDPATPGDPFTRLRFHYGQCLSAEDFEAEQRYFVLRQRLHNALLHGVGTVWGLAIRRQASPSAGGDQLICDPGMAIDPLGREIWVTQSLCLDLAAVETSFWAQLQPPPTAPPGAVAPPAAAPGEETPPSPAPARRRAYVVLRYVACLSDAVPVIPLPCADDQDGLAASRLRDSFRLCLEAEPPPDPYGTVRDISLRAGGGGRPRQPRRRERWRAPDGTIWIYDQPRNPDGTYRSDDPSTPLRESALSWQVERPGSLDASLGRGPISSTPGVAPWQGWRQLLVDHALNAPIAGAPFAPGPLERFWSGADDAALLLATLDLEEGNAAATTDLQPVRLMPETPVASNPNNAVRAVLPAVQATADLAFGIRLEGPVAPAETAFQAVAASARAVGEDAQPIGSGSAKATLIEVRLTLPVAKEGKALVRGIQVLHQPTASSGWVPLSPQQIRAVSTAQGPAVQLLLKPALPDHTPFQVVLSGTGSTALLSEGPRPQPLAGVAGEIVPPGSGRDAHLFGTCPPPAP